MLQRHLTDISDPTVRRPLPYSTMPLAHIAHARLAVTLAVSAGMTAPACTREVALSQPAAAGLSASTPMRFARSLHTATRLANGRILIVGGGTPESAVPSAELYDPASRTTRVIPLTGGRLGHTATLLANGSVLVVGGGYGSAESALTAEIFDPATERFRPTGAPTSARADHAAVLLPSGKVLLLGGDVSGVGSSPTASAELYDPATESFTPTGSMLAPRRPFGALVIADGSVLVAGGTSTNKRVIAEAEIYDAATGLFARTGALLVGREKHTASLLRDGTVLLVGGSDGSSERDRLSSSEIYDPRTGRFSEGPSLNTSRHKTTSVAMSDGSVLVVGGGSDLAERYDPTARRFHRIAGASDTERLYPAVTLLGDNGVMISGGYTRGGAQASTWIFRP